MSQPKFWQDGSPLAANSVATLPLEIEIKREREMEIKRYRERDISRDQLIERGREGER